MRWTEGWLALSLLLTAGCGGAQGAGASSADDEVCLDTEPSTEETTRESAGEDPPPRAGLEPIVRRLEDTARRASPNETAIVAILAQGENAFLARLEMNPGAAVPEHQDADEEYIFVLEGSGTITIDGESQEIGPGTAVFMPANATVSYQNGDARMVAIQVFAGPGSAAKYDRWSSLVR